MRINKYLADANYCSRREADRLIADGEVKINGKRAKLGDQVNPGDKVQVPGQTLELDAEKIYLAVNKPVGVICTTDKNARNTIVNMVASPERVYPVGRLDVSTSGLIIMTNDGDLVNKVLKAENKIAKEYVVEVDRKISPDFIGKLTKGMVLGRRKTLPAEVTKLNNFTFSITIIEGRKRQVRRMCEEQGYLVKSLTRVRIGGLKLDRIPLGQFKRLSEKNIKKALGLK